MEVGITLLMDYMLGNIPHIALHCITFLEIPIGYYCANIFIILNVALGLRMPKKCNGLL